MQEEQENNKAGRNSRSSFDAKGGGKWSGYVPAYCTKKTDTMMRGIAKRSDKKKSLDDYHPCERGYHILDTAPKTFWDSLLGIKRRRRYTKNVRVQQPVNNKKKR